MPYDGAPANNTSGRRVLHRAKLQQCYNELYVDAAPSHTDGAATSYYEAMSTTTSYSTMLRHNDGAATSHKYFSASRNIYGSFYCL